MEPLEVQERLVTDYGNSSVDDSLDYRGPISKRMKFAAEDDYPELIAWSKRTRVLLRDLVTAQAPEAHGALKLLNELEGK